MKRNHLILLLALLFFIGCKKDENPQPTITNTGICSGLSFYKSFPNPKNGVGYLGAFSHKMALSNTHIYGINGDGLFQLDFEGNIKNLLGPAEGVSSVQMDVDGKLYVFDFSKFRIYDAGFNLLETHIHNGVVDDDYVGLNSADRVVSCEKTDFDVKIYSYTTDTIIKVFGEFGLNDGQFGTAITRVDGDGIGNIYVDTKSSSPQIFDKLGNFIGKIETYDYVKTWLGGYVTYGASGVATFKSPDGTNKGTFYASSGSSFIDVRLSPDQNTLVIATRTEIHVYKK